MSPVSTTLSQDSSFETFIEEEAHFMLTIDATKVLEWVQDTFSPEEVFEEAELEEWASKNGWIKE